MEVGVRLEGDGIGLAAAARRRGPASRSHSQTITRRRYEYGGPLNADCIAEMIRRRSARAFGKGFGPHRFRHTMGTTAPLVDPAHPGLAAAILGISGHMVEQHYNLPDQVEAAERLQTSLRKDRAGLQSLARRGFRRQAKL